MSNKNYEIFWRWGRFCPAENLVQRKFFLIEYFVHKGVSLKGFSKCKRYLSERFKLREIIFGSFLRKYNLVPNFWVRNIIHSTLKKHCVFFSVLAVVFRWSKKGIEISVQDNEDESCLFILWNKFKLAVLKVWRIIS